jgi:hypothetical protein
VELVTVLAEYLGARLSFVATTLTVFRKNFGTHVVNMVVAVEVSVATLIRSHVPEPITTLAEAAKAELIVAARIPDPLEPLQDI